MDVGLHLRVIWRFKGVLIAGVLVGIAAAVLAAYQVSFAGGPKLTPRMAEEWASRSELLVTQRGFPWGRVTLPGATPAGEPAPPPAAPTTPGARSGGKPDVQFADPGRFATLASLYSVISFSDQARERLPERVAPHQIQAIPRSLDESNAVILPVLVILTKHDTAAKARRLNFDVVRALRDLLREQQSQARIPLNDRVTLQTLNFPSPAMRTVSRSPTMSIIAFVLSLICAIAWTHILANLRGDSAPRARRAEPNAAPAPSSILVDPERPRAVASRAVAPPRTTN